MPYEADVFIRQQIALEGVKNDVSYSFNDFANDVTEAAIILLMAMGRTSFEGMTKAEMRTFIATLNKRLAASIKSFQKLTETTLRAILSADIAVSRSIMGHLSKLTGAARRGRVNSRKLWASITGGIVPGSGMPFAAMVKEYFASIVGDTNKLLWMAYANNSTITETIHQITGTKANKYKDGLINRLYNKFSSTFDTLIQFLSINVTAVLGRAFTTHYEWISVIDSGTTDICRGRNGNVYEYGKGPLPPAHYRCRSRIHPLFDEGTATGPQTYYSWLKAQPPKVQKFVLGRSQYERLKRGDVSADAFPKFSSDRRLTPQQYKDSVNTLLTPSS